MIKLYQFKTSPFCEKIRRALNYKQLPFEICEVERAKVGEGKYSDVSASGKFPAIDDGGKAILDSSDIIYHLDNQYPDKPLVPSDAKNAAFAHIIEDWADESLYFYEMTMRIAWSHNNDKVIQEFVDTMPGLTVEQARPLIEKGVGDIVNAQGLGRKPQDQVVADCDRHFEAIDRLLESNDWLIGTAPSIADLAVISQLNALLYASEAQEALSKSKNISAWIERLDRVAPAN